MNTSNDYDTSNNGVGAPLVAAVSLWLRREKKASGDGFFYERRSLLVFHRDERKCDSAGRPNVAATADCMPPCGAGGWRQRNVDTVTSGW